MKTPERNFHDTRLVAYTITALAEALQQFAHYNPTATLPELLAAIKVEPQAVVTHLDTLVADAARYRHIRSECLTNSEGRGTPLNTSEYDAAVDVAIQDAKNIVVPLKPYQPRSF